MLALALTLALATSMVTSVSATSSTSTALPKVADQSQQIAKLNPEKKPATAFTAKKNAATYYNKESLANEQKLARQGLVKAAPDLSIAISFPGWGEMKVWDIPSYDFIKGEAPASVNPKQWEQAKLNLNVGLFKVTDNVYQVRNFDISNLTLVRGKTGWIIIDPLATDDTAKAAVQFANDSLGLKLPVSAIIYTHSHVDHSAGALGAISTETGAVKNLPIYASPDFVKYVLSENLGGSGVAMGRRSYLMYGTLLPKGELSVVDSGIGKGLAMSPNQSLLAPTVTITKPVEKKTIDGVKFTFQLTPGTEAPTEMNVYMDDEKVLLAAENCNGTLHNLLTLRGAEVRDPEKWAYYIDEAISLFGKDMTAVISTHNGPHFGNKESVEYMTLQRDAYQYINDQTLRLMNQGYTIEEVGRMVQFPKDIDDMFFNGQFHGTVNHNAKAVYQKYLGWYDGNPVNLNKLFPEDTAKKTIEYMGGADRALQLALADFEKGEYQWVAQVTKEIIYADPTNTQAKYLCADALEQLAYVCENPSWRNSYLAGAQELRQGIQGIQGIAVKYGSMEQISDKQVVAMMGALLNGPKADGKDIVINFVCKDTGNKQIAPVSDRSFSARIRNGVLVHVSDELSKYANVTLNMGTDVLYQWASGADFDASTIKASGSYKTEQIVALFDKANNQFNIMTPRAK